ncbi:MAG: hypothetical protein JXR88_15340 [Clostridia bacterium]|nr:hypothetical protein [Clostridia bacterium]
MKKLLSMVLVLAMVLSMTTLVFAEEGNINPIQPKDREERTVQRGERVISLFENYYPEMLDAMITLQANHQSFHETVQAEKEAVKAGFKEEFMTLRESVKNQEMTREEFQAMMEGFKSEREATKAELEPIFEEKKAEAEAIRSSIQDVFVSIKASLDAGNEDILPLLDDLYDLLASHLEMDYYYYDLVHEIIE